MSIRKNWVFPVFSKDAFKHVHAFSVLNYYTYCMQSQHLTSTQEKILDLAKKDKLKNMPLREMARIAQMHSPQIFKHHLNKLEQKGFVLYNKQEKSVVYKDKRADFLIPIPIYGSAIAGSSATHPTEKPVEGYLRISPKILGKKRKKSVFALIINGYSMNKEIMSGSPIENGNYVLVEKTRTVKNGDVIISVFDKCTTHIKKIERGKEYTLLKSNSKSHMKYPPIVVANDENMHIAGKVWYNIKS